jgi:hypothetical protein
MKDFLDDSRRYYVELPTELRARRRARAAPYCVPKETPESPIDDVFKDLSTWDHRRVRKVSEGKIRTRKVSEEKVRTRKTSEEKARARKLSEKKTKKVAPPPVPSLSLRTFSPFVDSVNAQGPQPTEEGLKVEPASLNSTVNSVGRAAKATGKMSVKQEPSQNTSSTKENVLRSKHSVEGMLERYCNSRISFCFYSNVLFQSYRFPPPLSSSSSPAWNNHISSIYDPAVDLRYLYSSLK